MQDRLRLSSGWGIVIVTLLVSLGGVYFAYDAKLDAVCTENQVLREQNRTLTRTQEQMQAKLDNIISLLNNWSPRMVTLEARVGGLESDIGEIKSTLRRIEDR